MADLEIYMVLDGSGSMGYVQDDVVDGINRFIEDQKDEKAATGDDIKFSLTVFDTNVVEKYLAEDVDLVDPVTRRDTFLGGGTALLDAVGRTITNAENLKTLTPKMIVIYTDGAENSSREFTVEQIKDLISKYEGQGDWQFVYMSAELADFNQPQAMGISGGNTITGTSRGTTGGQFAGLSNAASYHRTHGGGTTTSTLYSDSGIDASAFDGQTIDTPESTKLRTPDEKPQSKIKKKVKRS